MTYTLHIGDKLFSSWSLRGWLMLRKFGLPFEETMVGLYSGTLEQDLSQLAPARLVPVLKTPQGDVIGETIAMAETLAEQNPDAGLWPDDSSLRIRARWLCAEMASGFSALRGECPMQLAYVNAGFVPSQAVLADLTRLETIWAAARTLSGHSEGWLFGSYSLADVFFAPVAARIIGYDLPVSPASREYALQLISEPAFCQWRRAGLEKAYDPFPYPTFPPLGDWPVPLDGYD